MAVGNHKLSLITYTTKNIFRNPKTASHWKQIEEYIQEHFFYIRKVGTNC